MYVWYYIYYILYGIVHPIKLVFIIIDLFHVCLTALWVVSKIKRYVNIVYYY